MNETGRERGSDVLGGHRRFGGQVEGAWCPGSEGPLDRIRDVVGVDHGDGQPPV
ncbi:MAG: hypothetical protein WKF82_08870 [Nocardioidaceae bacterium]